MRYVYIPVQNSEEEVCVDLDNLPTDATDILDILKAEQAPLNLWLIIAREYYNQGKIDEFQQILEEGSSPEIDEYYANVKYDRVAILNALGAYFINRAKYETKQNKKDECFMNATTYINKASKIDQHEPSQYVVKGQLPLAKGEFEQAFNFIRIAVEGQADYVPALLGEACVLYHLGRYEESLELYKRALQANPGCPASVRLGLGLCRYKLGQFRKARQAFERVLQLDPENVEALVALAIMELQINEPESFREGIDKMRRAFEIYPYCAMALNHLADHFFFTGKHFTVERLTEAALASTQHSLMKSHSYYNLARSYHSKGDYETAGRYYLASTKESPKPQDFVLPYYGLAQVQLKLGEFKAALSNFEKVLEVHPENSESLKAVGYIYVQQKQTAKALEAFRKATRIDPHDAHAFLEMGELLISSDANGALNALLTARNILKRNKEEIPIELLNNIGVLHFERGEFELAQTTFTEALGDGIWNDIVGEKIHSPIIDASASSSRFTNMDIFYKLEEGGANLKLSWHKVTPLFNLARLFEQLNETEKASLLYQFIIFKFPDYMDSYLRLSAMTCACNNIQKSIELVRDALKVDERSSNALSMLGNLEVKADDMLKGKETFKAVLESTDGKDCYAALSLGNWNYFTGVRHEVKHPDTAPVFFDKSREMFNRALTQSPDNVYAANGAAILLAEKGLIDVAKDIFIQVQEAAFGNIFVQMPDVWVNLANVYFAQGQFSLAVKMYHNCLRKFYNGTDTNILLYMARTQYDATQWQEAKRTLLKAIHLAPSNFMLRFDVGIVMQKFSEVTLKKQKRTADEVRQAVSELKNALQVFNHLAAVASDDSHVFNAKKLQTHIDYCETLLDAAKIHREAAEREEQQNRHKIEVARQLVIAEEIRRKADEERRLQAERRKQEEELLRVQQQEEHFARVKELWKMKSKEKGDDDTEVSHSEKKRKKDKEREKDKEKKRRRKEKHIKHHGSSVEDIDADFGDDENFMMERPDNAPDNAQDLLAAAGLEDSDDGEMDAAITKRSRRRQAYSDSEEDMPLPRHSAEEDDICEPQTNEETEPYEPQFRESDGENADGLQDSAKASPNKDTDAESG